MREARADDQRRAHVGRDRRRHGSHVERAARADVHAAQSGQRVAGGRNAPGQRSVDPERAGRYVISERRALVQRHRMRCQDRHEVASVRDRPSLPGVRVAPIAALHRVHLAARCVRGGAVRDGAREADFVERPDPEIIRAALEEPAHLHGDRGSFHNVGRPNFDLREIAGPGAGRIPGGNRGVLYKEGGAGQPACVAVVSRRAPGEDRGAARARARNRQIGDGAGGGPVDHVGGSALRQGRPVAFRILRPNPEIVKAFAQETAGDVTLRGSGQDAGRRNHDLRVGGGPLDGRGQGSPGRVLDPEFAPRDKFSGVDVVSRRGPSQSRHVLAVPRQGGEPGNGGGSGGVRSPGDLVVAVVLEKRAGAAAVASPVVESPVERAVRADDPDVGGGRFDDARILE